MVREDDESTRITAKSELDDSHDQDHDSTDHDQEATDSQSKIKTTCSAQGNRVSSRSFGDAQTELHCDAHVEKEKQMFGTEIDEIIKSQKKASKNDQKTKQPYRKPFPFTIPHLIAQFNKMNIKADFVLHDIIAFNRMLTCSFSRTIHSRRRNKSIASKVKNVTVFEDPQDQNLHAHGLLECENKVSMRNKAYLNVPREFIVEWHAQNAKSVADKRYQDIVDDVKIDVFDDYLVHDFMVNDEREGKPLPFLYVHLETSSEYIGDTGKWLHYIFKTYGHNVDDMVNDDKAALIGSKNRDIQKRIDDYIRRQEKRNKKGSGDFKRIGEMLQKCNTAEELETKIAEIERTESWLALYKGNGYKNLKRIHQRRIYNDSFIKKKRERTNIPHLDHEWSQSDFNYGDGVKNRQRIVDIYNNACKWITTFIQHDPKVNSKCHCLVIEGPKVRIGKTLLLHLLSMKYNEYVIRLDKGWQGGHYSRRIDYFRIDSANEDHFGPDGLAYSVLEAIAGGQPTFLTRRNMAPIQTHGQPIIITTQYKLRKLGYFAKKQQNGKSIAWSMLMERATYIRLLPQRKREESLVPLCFYIQKLWNIKTAWGENAKTKAEIGLHNVICTEDEDSMEEIRDKDHPGEYYSSSPDAEVNYYSIFEKIKDRSLFWYPGMEQENDEMQIDVFLDADDDDDVEFDDEDVQASGTESASEESNSKVMGHQFHDSYVKVFDVGDSAIIGDDDGTSADETTTDQSFQNQGRMYSMQVTGNPGHEEIIKAKMDVSDFLESDVFMFSTESQKQNIQTLVTFLMTKKQRPMRNMKMAHSIAMEAFVRFLKLNAVGYISKNINSEDWDDFIESFALDFYIGVNWRLLDEIFTNIIRIKAKYKPKIFGTLTCESTSRTAEPSSMERKNGQPWCWFISLACMCSLIPWPVSLRQNGKFGDFFSLVHSLTNKAGKVIQQRNYQHIIMQFVDHYNLFITDEKRFWSISEQQNVTAALNHLLENVEDTVKELVSFCTTEEIVCPTENKFHTNEEIKQNILALPLPVSTWRATLQDLFINYTTTEKINDYDCAHCNQKHSVYKRILLTDCSEYLFVELKRSGINVKRKTNKIYCEHGLVFEIDDEYVAYELIASIDHWGDAKFGHFVTNLKLDEVWWRLNDAHRKSLQELDRQNCYLILLKRASGKAREDIIEYFTNTFVSNEQNETEEINDTSVDTEVVSDQEFEHVVNENQEVHIDWCKSTKEQRTCMEKLIIICGSVITQSVAYNIGRVHCDSFDEFFKKSQKILRKILHETINQVGDEYLKQWMQANKVYAEQVAQLIFEVETSFRVMFNSKMDALCFFLKTEFDVQERTDSQQDGNQRQAPRLTITLQQLLQHCQRHSSLQFDIDDESTPTELADTDVDSEDQTAVEYVCENYELVAEILYAVISFNQDFETVSSLAQINTIFYKAWHWMMHSKMTIDDYYRLHQIQMQSMWSSQYVHYFEDTKRFSTTFLFDIGVLKVAELTGHYNEFLSEAAFMNLTDHEISKLIENLYAKGRVINDEQVLKMFQISFNCDGNPHVIKKRKIIEVYLKFNNHG